MPTKEVEQASLLLAFTISIVDVRYLNLLSRAFWPIMDYMTSRLPTAELHIEGLAAFESLMTQLVVFTLDLVVYFVVFYILIFAIRKMA
ncbi:MAG: hypothetical protein QXX77_01230 [Candidatus Methanosuratincola sp.]